MTTEAQRHPSDDRSRENARTAIEDAVYAMLDAGFTRAEVEAEVEYTLDNREDVDP